MGVGNRDSGRGFIKILNILSLTSQYVFCLLLFVVNSNNQFRVNSEIHINTRKSSDLYQPFSHFTLSDSSLLYGY